MLSVHQAATIAFLGDGYVVHASEQCLGQETFDAAYEIRDNTKTRREGHPGYFHEVSLIEALAEAAGLTPISRYEINDWAYEQTYDWLYELSEEELESLIIEADELADLADIGNVSWTDDYREALIDYCGSNGIGYYPVTCDTCGKEIE